MERLALILLPMIAATAHAGTINGVGSITTNFNANSNAPGGTKLVNTGTILDGLYGTENLGYLVDNFPGAIGYNGLIIKATGVINDDGSVNGADNSATLGYTNPVTGHRSETLFGVNFHAPNDGRIWAMIGGNANVGPIGNWVNSFGRNHPFNIDLTASLAGNMLTVTGTIGDGITTINVNTSGNVNPASTMEAFGTSSGFTQPGTVRNFGMDFSNVIYNSTIPEPASYALAALGMAIAGASRRRRRA